MDNFMVTNFTGPGDITLKTIWDGDGTNDNAALTVFRHVESATVEKGLIGEPPKTAWVIGYGLLEKIHYLLVAGYDVYGNLGHQLISRVYMDFMRMEGETHFLLLLPREARERERRFWYRGADKQVDEYMTLSTFETQELSQIEYQTDDEKLELYAMLKKRLAPVLSQRYALSSIDNPAVRSALSRLKDLRGPSVTWMPELSFAEITGPSGNEYVTIVHNRAHLHITSIFGEKKSLAPDEDRLTVVPGFLGAYPDVFFRLNEQGYRRFHLFDFDIGRFRWLLQTARSLRDPARTDPNFWQQSDVFHAAYRTRQPVEFGLFDYNRFDNR